MAAGEVGLRKPLLVLMRSLNISIFDFLVERTRRVPFALFRGALPHEHRDAFGFWFLS